MVQSIVIEIFWFSTNLHLSGRKGFKKCVFSKFLFSLRVSVCSCVCPQCIVENCRNLLIELNQTSYEFHYNFTMDERCFTTSLVKSKSQTGYFHLKGRKMTFSSKPGTLIVIFGSFSGRDSDRQSSCTIVYPFIAIQRILESGITGIREYSRKGYKIRLTRDDLRQKKAYTQASNLGLTLVCNKVLLRILSCMRQKKVLWSSQATNSKCNDYIVLKNTS